MLKQASLEDVTSHAVTRDQGYLVLCMRLHPRGVKAELRDEYVRALSPDEKLFNEFIAMKRKLGDHNAAFRVVRYEERFRLSDEGRTELERLSKLAREKDVYLICQCGPGERCHRDLLLLEARLKLGAEAAAPRLTYPVFEKRLKQ